MSSFIDMEEEEEEEQEEQEEEQAVPFQAAQDQEQEEHEEEQEEDNEESILDSKDSYLEEHEEEQEEHEQEEDNEESILDSKDSHLEATFETEEDTTQEKLPDGKTEKEDRKSSFGFDSYKFENPVVDDEIPDTNDEEEEEKEKFIKLARLKKADYSKIDLVKLASTATGLQLRELDENLVEPIPILDETEADARTSAVREIYGPNVKPESDPFQDPLTELEKESEEAVNILEAAKPKNLYEALQSNFLRSNYKTPIFRLILLGTQDENLTQLIEWNQTLIDTINVESYTEKLQGVLCMYEYYYIHVLEGSEDNMSKLMRTYANELEPSEYDWNLKFHYNTLRFTSRNEPVFKTVKSYVLGIFRLKQRHFQGWRGEKVFPNRMHVTDIPHGGYREKYFHFIKKCIIMAQTFNLMGVRFPSGQTANRQPLVEDAEKDEQQAQMWKAIERAKIQRFKSLGQVIVPITLIQYVLDNKDNSRLKVRNIREYLETFGSSPPYISSTQTDWPPPGRVAPYD